MGEKNSAAGSGRASLGSADAQEQEIKNIYRYFKDRPEVIERHADELNELAKDPTIQKAFRRHSDQFRNIKENRLSYELEKNRKLRLIHKFKKEHTDIENITNRWRDILLCAFEDLVKYTDSKAVDLYNAFHLKSIHVQKDEVGIYSEEDPSTENE
ncbi:hypothetical protein NEMIN01_1853 [Nematocida minor]|uniref:uncharacterized protein n=1 Tax=Nematocida minor TaxID=1912983 RepID=UPI00221EE959|nr:uncharacterized protein NEMIN01_1853 [Nematocida minor]KAI5192160.1 hypothetical protein NEMIN01_1853 [Nematocida minor]